MCDPLTAVAIAGSALSAGAGIYEGQQQAAGLADVQNKQNQANQDWVAYQTRIHQQQVAQEDAARERATGVQQSTLQKVSAPQQEAEQGAEQERLNTLYTKPGASGAAGTGSTNPNDLLLSGENPGNQTFMDSLTTQVNNATSQARSRIQALATANSYGGSFGGLGTTVPIQFAQGGNDINALNAVRQGNLKTYGVQQQVQPINYAIGPGTEAAGSIAKGAMSIAGSLAGFAGPRVASSGVLSGLFSGGGGAAAGGGSAYDNLDYGSFAGTPDFSYLPDNTFNSV
jgi:hypothetical protein